MNRTGFKCCLVMLVALAVIFPAQACHTPTRAAELGKRFPDWDFVAMAHKAHMEQERIGVKFNGRQNCVNGQAGEFACNNVDLVGFLDLTNFFGGSGSDSWGWKHEASNRYFALLGLSHGTAFVDITQPEDPIFTAYLPSSGGTSVWRDIKVYQDHAFIVADGAGAHGMQVFDLSRLLDFSGATVTVEADVVYRYRLPISATDFEEAHNIVINEESGFAYLVGSNLCFGGLYAVNIQDPKSPTYAGCYLEDGYTHDAQCVNYQGPDLFYNGQEICFASNEDTLTIVNMTDKENPVLISKGSYPDFGYTHQGWLTPDQRYFIMDDEIDERSNRHNTRTYVFDLNDLDNPVFTGFHESDGPAIDHNQYIIGEHTYQANYSRGLRILKLNDLSKANMEEVAWFDTFPEADSIDSFSGAWNVYPFFDNGLILVSDINRGIFILKANLGDEPPFQINQGLSGAWFNPQTPGQGMLVDVQPDDNFIFVSWFVHEAAQSSSSIKVGDDNHRWLTMQGNYQDGTATLPVFNSSGGRFNDPTAVNTEQVGTATLRFDDCSSASVEYNLEDGNLTGTIDLQRLLPSAAALCESLAAGQAGSSDREQLDSAP